MLWGWLASWLLSAQRSAHENDPSTHSVLQDRGPDSDTVKRKTYSYTPPPPSCRLFLNFAPLLHLRGPRTRATAGVTYCRTIHHYSKLRAACAEAEAARFCTIAAQHASWAVGRPYCAFTDVTVHLQRRVRVRVEGCVHQSGSTIPHGN